MLTTVEGTFKAGKIELSEVPAGIEQAPVLVTFLPRPEEVAVPVALYGVWKDKFPPDFDIDTALSEIRGQSAAALDPVSGE